MDKVLDDGDSLYKRAVLLRFWKYTEKKNILKKTNNAEAIKHSLMQIGSDVKYLAFPKTSIQIVNQKAFKLSIKINLLNLKAQQRLFISK